MSEKMQETHTTVTKITGGKSTLVALILWFFLGGFGMHRFYANKPKTGGLMLIITLIGFIFIFPLIITAIWLLVDLLLIILGKFDLDQTTIVTTNS